MVAQLLHSLFPMHFGDQKTYTIVGSFVTGNKDGELSQPGGMILQAIDNGHPIMNVEINYRLGCSLPNNGPRY